MGRTLPEDFRSRVVGAVEGGLSRRAAAERFGVGVANTLRWVRVVYRDPQCNRGPGGHHAGRAGGDAPARHGAHFALSTVWRFLDRHTITFKKQRTRVSRNGPTSRPSDAPGSTFGLTSTPSAWSSSTRPAPRPKWPDYAAGPDAVSAAVLRSRTAIGRRPPSPAHSACQAWQGPWSSAGP
jgi:hypothetical protein